MLMVFFLFFLSIFSDIAVIFGATRAAPHKEPQTPPSLHLVIGVIVQACPSYLCKPLQAEHGLCDLIEPHSAKVYEGSTRAGSVSQLPLLCFSRFFLACLHLCPIDIQPQPTSTQLLHYIIREHIDRSRHNHKQLQKPSKGSNLVA